MRDKILRPLIAAVGATLAVRLNTFFLAKDLGDLPALALAILCAVTLAKVLEILAIEAPMHVAWMRRKMDPLHSIEGYWYERVTSADHPHSYACIEYDVKGGRFRYSGQNFTPDLILNATFSSETVEVRRDATQITFAFNADVERPARSRVRGYATIAFHSDGKRQFTRGDGSFVETDGPTGNGAGGTQDLRMREVSFRLDRISEQKVMRALGKRAVESNSDIVKLISSTLK